MTTRVKRPDLETLKAAAEPATIYSDTQGWLAGHLLEVIAYAAQLEQDAVALQDRLRAMEWDQQTEGHQCFWCLMPRFSGHEDDCKFAALLAAGS